MNKTNKLDGHKHFRMSELEKFKTHLLDLDHDHRDELT